MEQQTDPAPSQIRERLLREHASLRELVGSVDAAAERVLEGDPSARDTLEQLCRALHMALSAHLDLEDAVLAPALRDTDAFGPDRSDELLQHHAEQRRILDRVLAGGVSKEDPKPVAREVRTLVQHLLIDMDHEDRDLLDPRLLKDDPILVDGFTG
jgi:iron-sulfur cluster repair protein YtfE (RIC family)